MGVRGLQLGVAASALHPAPTQPYTAPEVLHELACAAGVALKSVVASPVPRANVTQHVGAWTMVSKTNTQLAFAWLQLLDNAAHWVHGDVVECGVWKGGVSAAMMLAHLAALDGAPARDFWLFDTFAGMSEPSAEDGAFANERFAMIANRTFTKASSLGGVRDHKWTFGGTLREVARNVAHTGYPCDRVHLVQGKVEDSTRSRAVPLPKRIALLRIDTDWYNSTMCELHELLPLLEPRGVLIIDDYHYWQGARQATIHFFGEPLLARALERNKHSTLGLSHAKIGQWSPHETNFHMVRSGVPNELDPATGRLGLMREQRFWL